MVIQSTRGRYLNFPSVGFGGIFRACKAEEFGKSCHVKVSVKRKTSGNCLKLRFKSNSEIFEKKEI
jgi:hypothetical protein